MNRYFGFSRISALVLAAVVAVCGMGVMVAADVKSESEKTEMVVQQDFDNPSAGMAAILSDYVKTKGEASIDFLSTTAVGMNIANNKYYDDNGETQGRLIVCTKEGGTNVYEEADTDSAAVGFMPQYAVATQVSVIDEESSWIKIVSDQTSGYVNKNDFAFGTEAEALEDRTYKTMALIDTDELTLREERSMEATALCILASNSLHEVIDDTDEDMYDPDWTKLDVEGVGQGYVLTYYIVIDQIRMYAISNEQQERIDGQIEAGLDEAASREEMWLNERLAVEEEQRQAAIRAEEEAEAARIAAEEARLAAEAAEAEEAAEAARRAEEAAEAARQAAARASEEARQKALADAQAAEEAAAAAWASYSDAEANAAYQEQLSSVAGQRQALVDYACSFAGWLPYVSGGRSLSSGADCSGFTQAIFAEFGYYIGATPNAQACDGYSVPLSEIQPGDLIIYSGHVAIYVGNGQKVHEPYPGQCVTVNSMYYMTILDVRRIIG